MELTPYFAAGFGALGSVLMGLAIYAFRANRSDTRDVAKTLGDQSEQLARIETILTGADGTNGLNGEVKLLRQRTHALGDALHATNGKLQDHEFRLGRLEHA